MTNGSTHAFPHMHSDGNTISLEGGLSKREYFAGLAMQGMIAGGQGLKITIEEFAKQSVLLSDALLLELSKERE